MYKERLYQVALTMVKYVGQVHAKQLVQHFGSATAIFTAPRHELERIAGMGEVRAKSLQQFNRFSECELLLKQAEQYQLQVLFLNDPDYPQRLLNCYDPPTLLYKRGRAGLNAHRMVAVVGTRHNTEYGRQQTERLIGQLVPAEVTVVSGMAYGTDGLAHRAALKAGLPTVGVLAHGLDRIYPPHHTGLARDILDKGGALVTEFPIGTQPDRHHFPIRNRIVAGLSDAVIVTETGISGGSMITAGLAGDYNRDVFAFPGKVTDPKSSGCNWLIGRLKASLITSGENFLEAMRWNEPQELSAGSRQLPLLTDLDPAAASIVRLLGIHEILPIDELYLRSGLSAGTAASVILELELKNIIKSLPGKRYSLQ